MDLAAVGLLLPDPAGCGTGRDIVGLDPPSVTLADSRHVDAEPNLGKVTDLDSMARTLRIWDEELAVDTQTVARCWLPIVR